jgi:uncharacterized membrane protein YadS
LIGVTAFGVAVYWVWYVDTGQGKTRPQAREIWRRFPKFVLGFMAASALFSLIAVKIPRGPIIVDAVLKQGIDALRDWFFAFAFVSIGLETDFRALGVYLRDGKPVLLYVCGQTLNLCLTLAMAALMFLVVFRDVTAELLFLE